MYKDSANPWHIHQLENAKAGQRHWFNFTPASSQETVITVDFENPRKRGPECAAPKYLYNLYLVANNAIVAGPTLVSNRLGYGQIVANVNAGTTYHVLVVNWDSSAASTVSKFTLSTYGATSQNTLTAR
jgi:hypothetical protein